MVDNGDNEEDNEADNKGDNAADNEVAFEDRWVYF